MYTAFKHFVFSVVCAALVSMFFSFSASAQLVWGGVWKTNFGDIRLVQQGKRVYGDYAHLGVLEGVLSANSMVYRGTFQRDDGKWGTFHFQRLPNGYRFKGHWRFDGVTKRQDSEWSGERISGKVPQLSKAVGRKRYWAHAIGLKPTGAFKTFVENKPRGIKLPSIPGLGKPLRPQPVKPVQPIVSDGGSEPNEEEFNDLPGSGVTGPAYRFRSVPAGRNLMLRAGPSRQSAKLGPISGDATEIFVFLCVPHIDPVRFDQANPDQKRLMLSGSWCLISHEQNEGYVPGTYLDPILDR